MLAAGHDLRGETRVDQCRTHACSQIRISSADIDPVLSAFQPVDGHHGVAVGDDFNALRFIEPRRGDVKVVMAADTKPFKTIETKFPARDRGRDF